MKVKVINKNTNRSFDCEEVEIGGYKYYLYYNTEPKKIGQYYITKDNQVDIVKTGEELGKPILCSNNPNIDIPKVVDEVQRLAKNLRIKKQSMFGNSFEFDLRISQGFILGYNKHEETHPFSEENMIEFAEWMRDVKSSIAYEDETCHRLYKKSTKELLQLWKEQKTKIIYYA